MLTNEQKKSILNDRIKEAEGQLMVDPGNENLILEINVLKNIDKDLID